MVAEIGILDYSSVTPNLITTGRARLIRTRLIRSSPNSKAMYVEDVKGVKYANRQHYTE